MYGALEADIGGAKITNQGFKAFPVRTVSDDT